MYSLFSQLTVKLFDRPFKVFEDRVQEANAYFLPAVDRHTRGAAVFVQIKTVTAFGFNPLKPFPLENPHQFPR